jgi:hypothetical protein
MTNALSAAKQAAKAPMIPEAPFSVACRRNPPLVISSIVAE